MDGDGDLSCIFFLNLRWMLWRSWRNVQLCRSKLQFFGQNLRHTIGIGAHCWPEQPPQRSRVTIFHVRNHKGLTKILHYADYAIDVGWCDMMWHDVTWCNMMYCNCQGTSYWYRWSKSRDPNRPPAFLMILGACGDFWCVCSGESHVSVVQQWSKGSTFQTWVEAVSKWQTMPIQKDTVQREPVPQLTLNRTRPNE